MLPLKRTITLLQAVLIVAFNNAMLRADETPTTRPTTILLVGDSTVTPNEGWGKGFALRLTDAARCVNHAAGGRSSKSFRDEGRWEKALASKPDYVLLQFGHNDQPGKGPRRETDPDTTFSENLRRYIDEARAAGAKPILVTSLARRYYDAQKKIRNHQLAPFVAATKKVAQEKNVPLIDLSAQSIALFERLGEDEANKLGPTSDKGPDRTHLNAQGSDSIAELVCHELKRVVPELAGSLK